MLADFSSFSCTSRSGAAQLSCPRWRQSFLPPPPASHSLQNPASRSPTHSAGPTINLGMFYLKYCWAESPHGREEASSSGERREPLPGRVGFVWGEARKKEKGSKTSFLWHWGATRVASLPVQPQPSGSCFHSVLFLISLAICCKKRAFALRWWGRDPWAFWSHFSYLLNPSCWPCSDRGC